jgi:hypothetical protein
MPVRFIHKDRFLLQNIGDYLCSPRHYLNFDVEDELIILGGGAFNGLGIEQMHNMALPFQRTVAWGIGQSVRNEFGTLAPIDNLPYVRWGIRDRNAVADLAHFVPCVSCFHPIVDMPIEGASTLIFLNRDSRVTPPEAVRSVTCIARRPGWQVLFNDCSDRMLLTAWRTATSVITNSYHGAYWSLLSGRRAIIIGYSSKFSGLLSSIGIPVTSLLRYVRGNADDLSRVVTQIEEGEGFVSLDDPAAVKAEMRAANLRFAQSLVDSGLIRSFALKTTRPSSRIASPLRVAKSLMRRI